MPRIAAVQMDVQLGNNSGNLDRIEWWLRQSAAAGAALTVFPECALPGYCFGSLQEAWEFSETIPGPSTNRLTALCQELQVHVVVGMLEQAGDRLFNAAVLIGPSGVVGNYRKVHLPFLGIDMFTTPGDQPFAVYEAGDIRVGMLICYDASFPEATRCLTLAGADIVVLPTNWPPGSETTAAHVINARAVENGIYFLAVNRVGTERGFSFIGQSRIAAPTGHTLAINESTQEGLLLADISLERARNKHYVRVPGKHEIDRLADRRPETYAPLVTPHQLPRPGRDKPPAEEA